MLKEDKRYDICGVLLSELMGNLKKIKQDKKHVFKFCSLIVYLALHFLNEIPIIGKVQLAYDKLMAIQIKEGLQGLGDTISHKYALWGYFKSFQAMIKSRERIPRDVVEKYEITVYFMMDKDKFHMEAVEPRTILIITMGYEVDGNTLDAYAQHLLSKLVDEKEERLCTYKEKYLDLPKKFTKLERKRKVRKEVEELAKQMGISKEVVQRAREKNILKEEDMVKPKKIKPVSTPPKQSKLRKYHSIPIPQPKP